MKIAGRIENQGAILHHDPVIRIGDAEVSETSDDLIFSNHDSSIGFCGCSPPTGTGISAEGRLHRRHGISGHGRTGRYVGGGHRGQFFANQSLTWSLDAVGVGFEDQNLGSGCNGFGAELHIDRIASQGADHHRTDVLKSGAGPGKDGRSVEDANRSLGDDRGFSESQINHRFRRLEFEGLLAGGFEAVDRGDAAEEDTDRLVIDGTVVVRVPDFPAGHRRVDWKRLVQAALSDRGSPVWFGIEGRAGEVQSAGSRVSRNGGGRDSLGHRH